MGTTPASSPALIAYDGSEEAEAAIEAAGRLLGGRAAVVAHVYETPPLPIVPGPGPGLAAATAITPTDQDVSDAATEEAASAAWKVAEHGADLATEVGLPSTPQVRPGGGGTSGVWLAIVELAADLQASVIVVGSRGRSGIKAALLGSVSSGVLHHADRPVLVVREPERAEAA